MTELTLFIKQCIKALETENTFVFRQNYKDITLQAALNSDKQLALLAMIFYSLNKLLSKSYVKKSPAWFRTKKDLLILLDKSLISLKQNNQSSFSGLLDMIAQEIFLFDKSMGHFETNIIDKSRLKIASVVYGLGYSFSVSAALTNADKKSLLEYLGMSIANSGLIPVLSINDRISFLGVLR